ncbi:MAG TPA: nucleoside triphosphatase YtkD [Bacilli bacterium]|nr:nucleoside triphosphatase YtkD [Bacilli bacterium]
MEADYRFYNSTGQFIQLTFSESDEVNCYLDHVWVICRYQQKWLLTNHKERGLEFPGGKIEQNEVAEQAVYREVFEETGGIIETLKFVGFYVVKSEEVSFNKGIYFARIEKLEEKDDYLETDGPMLVDELSAEIVKNAQFSFIMQDDVLLRTLEYLQENKIY